MVQGVPALTTKTARLRSLLARHFGKREIASRLPDSLESTVAVLGRGRRRDNGLDEVFILGSGVAVEREVVLTANHVNWASSEVYSSLEVLVGADHQYNPTTGVIPWVPVTQFSADPPRDLLLLRAPGLTSKPARLRSRNPSQGESLYWVGHPGAGQAAPVTSSGIVATQQLVPHYPRGVSMNIVGLRLDGSTLAGNSGGGVFDLNGYLGGIICAGPLQISSRHLDTLLQAQNGGGGLIGGVDVVAVLRDLIDELVSTTRPGIAYAIGIEAVHGVLPVLLRALP